MYCSILGQETVETVASIYTLYDNQYYTTSIFNAVDGRRATTPLRRVKGTLIFKPDNSTVLITLSEGFGTRPRTGYMW